MSVKVWFVDGTMRGTKTELLYAPPQVVVLGERYDRIDDPDTGEYLGAYALHKDPTPVFRSDFWYDRELFKYDEINAAPRKAWWRRWFK